MGISVTFLCHSVLVKLLMSLVRQENLNVSLVSKLKTLLSWFLSVIKLNLLETNTFLQHQFSNFVSSYPKIQTPQPANRFPNGLSRKRLTFPKLSNSPKIYKCILSLYPILCLSRIS